MTWVPFELVPAAQAVEPSLAELAIKYGCPGVFTSGICHVWSTSDQRRALRMDEARRGAGNNWVSKITVAVKTISERIQGYSNKLTEVERMLVMGIVSKRIAEQDTDSDGGNAG